MPYWDHASATHPGWRFRVALSRGPWDSFPPVCFADSPGAGMHRLRRTAPV